MLSLTQSKTFLIGPIAIVLGYIMEGIYRLLDIVNHPDIGMCIIIFTIVVYLLMFPMTLKQQKFSKMSAVMNPEIKAIQKKYENKKDQESMMQQNDEIRAVYEKYGTSPTGGCLQLIIQMPILFALYRVIMNIPAYVQPLKDIYMKAADAIVANKEYAQTFVDLAKDKGISGLTVKNLAESKDYIVDTLYKFSNSDWENCAKVVGKTISDTQEKLNPILHFCGINLSESPVTILKNSNGKVGIIIVAIAIPVLAGVFQFLQTKLAPSQVTEQNGEENAMLSSMKTMNTVMPLMSVFFCFTFASGLGLYWAFGAFVRCIQQFFINKHLEKTDINVLIEKNLEKVNKKRAKSGLPPKTLSNAAKVNTKSTTFDAAENKKLDEQKKKNREESIKKSSEYYNSSSEAKSGSLRSKADMVKKYNEKNNK